MKTLKLPDLGSRVRVVTRHKEIYIHATSPWRDTTFEGVVVPSNKWDQPSTFKLHTGNPDWPDSVISIDNVHDIKYLTGQAGRAVNVGTKSWTVTGSKGDVYTVTQTGTRWNCTCSGFQFRKACKHVKEKQG
jgi:hypothetical protein